MDARIEHAVDEIEGFMHVHLDAMQDMRDKGLDSFIASQGAKAALEVNFREKTARCIKTLLDNATE